MDAWGSCLLSLQIMRVGSKPGAANISKLGKGSKRKPASFPRLYPLSFLVPLPVDSMQALNRLWGSEERCFNLASYAGGRAT